MRLAFLPAVLLALAQGENQAEKLFRESEKKLAEADQVQITVESTLEGTYPKGTLGEGTLLSVAKGNKVCQHGRAGEPHGEEFKMSHVSYGTKM